MTEGEKDLKKLLQDMKPELQEGVYVFCTVQIPTDRQAKAAIGMFREAEGVTLIMQKEKADEEGLPYHFEAAWITLQVHSSLEAVGLTAAFSGILARGGISCNVVAGYYHDHIFLNYELRHKALALLTQP